MDLETTNLYLGWAAIFAGFIGPISAVIITLIWERVRHARELKFNAIQNILATRGRYSDPLYSTTIRIVPLIFAKSKKVMHAYTGYMDATRLEPNDKNRETVIAESNRRESILISEILADVGYKGLTAEQIESYTSQGLVNRETLVEHALLALPHIAFNVEKSAKASELICNSIVAQNNTPATQQKE